VVSVDPRADPQTRQASVLAVLPAGAGFTPGESIRGDIAVGEQAAAPTAPRQALLYDGDRPYLFVTTAGAAHRRDVEVGVEQGDRVQIRSGVRAGERVVVDGGSALSDGMAVREQGAQRSAP
jgi:membrane fusion protein (multidrug efflux system)